MTPKKIIIPDYHYEPEIDPKCPWVLDENFSYYSERYDKWVHLKKGMRSDGATGAIDIVSAGWWVHDELTNTYQWADGTPCTRWQSSVVLSDILESEGYKYRKTYWKYATYLPYLWGKVKAKFSF